MGLSPIKRTNPPKPTMVELPADDNGTPVWDDPWWPLSPFGVGDVVVGEPASEKVRVLDAPEPSRKAPLPSAEEVIARLRELLEGDPAFVACYALPEDSGVRFRDESSFALVVRRSCAEGSWELLDALDADPVLRRARVAFVVAWAGAPPERMDQPWYARGRLLERLSPWSDSAFHMDNAVFEASVVVEPRPGKVPPLDDHRVIDAVLAALERRSLLPVQEPLHGDALRVCAHWILGSMPSITAAGLLRAGGTETKMLVAWVEEALRAVAVEEALTRAFPGLPWVIVTGRQRLTEHFEHHLLRLNVEMKRTLPDTSVHFLAPMLARALGEERFFENRKLFGIDRRAGLRGYRSA